MHCGKYGHDVAAPGLSYSSPGEERNSALSVGVPGIETRLAMTGEVI
jgi:hypothetical protein